MPYCSQYSKEKSYNRTYKDSLKAYLDADRQSRPDKLTYRSIFTDIVADSEISATKAPDVFPKLHHDGFIKAILLIQDSPLVVGKFFVIEWGPRHLLQKNKQNKCYSQKRQNGYQNPFQNILFQRCSFLSETETVFP
jgi:hypothetical protein